LINKKQKIVIIPIINFIKKIYQKYKNIKKKYEGMDDAEKIQLK